MQTANIPVNVEVKSLKYPEEVPLAKLGRPFMVPFMLSKSKSSSCSLFCKSDKALTLAATTSFKGGI